MNTRNYRITQLLAISSRYALPWTWCSDYSALRHHISHFQASRTAAGNQNHIYPLPPSLFIQPSDQYSPSIRLKSFPLVSKSISTMPDRCPFCNIAATNPPAPFNEPPSESAAAGPISDASKTTAHMILSTEHVMAFLDIMPLTPGHVLVAPRRHYEMLGDMGVQAGQEVCVLLFLFLLTICLALVLPVLYFSSVFLFCSLLIPCIDGEMAPHHLKSCDENYLR